MKIDLRTDFEKMYRYIVKRTCAYSPEHNPGPGDTDQPIRSITIAFEFEQIGYALLIFDTRPDYEPDGEWGDHTSADGAQFPYFDNGSSAFEDGEVHVVSQDGTTLTFLDTDEDFQRYMDLIGDTFKQVLLKARDNGVFEPLPKAEVCELGVESNEGLYGWPSHEDRGTVNLV